MISWNSAPTSATAADSFALKPSITPVDLLRNMSCIRQFEERILELSRAGEVMGSVHPCVGQESPPVAVTAALDQRDRVVATYRGHGWALARGVPLTAMFGELLGLESGVNGGRGGSAYLSAPDYGFIGENSIVGAGLPIADGLAMALQNRGDGGVAVVSFGDGATNQGAAHEALSFAHARRLPVLFVCENNAWSEMTPISLTAPNIKLHERARAYGVLAQFADGSDVRQLANLAREAIKYVRSGDGPYFLEIAVPRLLGHYNRDVEHYRTEEDRGEHRRRDPIATLAQELTAAGELSGADLERLTADVARALAHAEEQARRLPAPDPGSARSHVVADYERSAPGSTTQPERVATLKYGLAVNRALDIELAERPDVVLFGEDIGVAGGTFGVTRNLRRRYGERVFDTPISEAAILGAAVGASMEGLRPVVEIMWSDFVFVALDQIVNQAANVRYLARGTRSAPLVVRMQQGVTPGSCAQHSQSIEAILAHIPGIKVGMPSTADDAFAMTRAAIADPDPVILIESRTLYLDSAEVNLNAPIEAVGGARPRRRGGDGLIVTWSAMVGTALAAAQQLSDEAGIEVSVLDLRWISPLDEDAIRAGLQDSGGVLLVLHEANLSGGFGAEVLARVSERHSDLLVCPPVRLGLPNVRVPAAPVLQRALIPDVEDLFEAMLRMIKARTNRTERGAAE